AAASAAAFRSELRRGLVQHWYDDRYRTVPEGLRSSRILDDYPALAGQKRTIGALRAALAATL
ncbi:hypothetical protein ACLBUT_33810, partial [Pseudomonas aeruginosa]|uniref:hypothetical protein n=1 Tax=Pseudomonas aeruginosa TaxID=287 RepID=UPI003968048A